MNTVDFDKKITITLDDYANASARAIAEDEGLNELFSHSPHMILVASMISTKIGAVLFDLDKEKDEPTEETAESESEGET